MRMLRDVSQNYGWNMNGSIKKWVGYQFKVDLARYIVCSRACAPTCGSEVTLIRVGGTPRFLNEMVFMGDHEIHEWEKPPEEGSVEFLCKNGHEHRVGYSFVSGDWS